MLPISLSGSAIVKNDGTISINIRPPSQGNAVSGTLTLIGVDNSGLWSVNTNGSTVSFPPTGGVTNIYFVSGSSMIINGTGLGLSPGAVVTAYLNGIIGPPDQVIQPGGASPLPPGSNSSVPSVASTVVSGTHFIVLPALATGRYYVFDGVVVTGTPGGSVLLATTPIPFVFLFTAILDANGNWSGPINATPSSGALAFQATVGAPQLTLTYAIGP